VTIEAISNRGDSGVAKIEGFVIFVPGTKVDEKVKIKITKVGNGYATAELADQSSNEQATSEDASSDTENSQEGETEEKDQ
jgi:predicted RNA-binding protein with TRAM domain